MCLCTFSADDGACQLPYLISPHLVISSHLILPISLLLHLTCHSINALNLISLHLIFLYFTSSHLILSHLVSSYLIALYLISSLFFSSLSSHFHFYPQLVRIILIPHLHLYLSHPFNT